MVYSSISGCCASTFVCKSHKSDCEINISKNSRLTPFCRTIVVNSTYVVGQFVPQTGITSQLLYEILKDIDLKLL